ncbi:MAG TPA: hypothetical protein PKD78_05400, partial [Saprospiraceae bacterium]|nr:hypothetical protein [Saprospiraceae bacterium]
LLPVDTVICAGEPVELTIEFSGTGPFSYRLDSSGVLLPQVTNIATNPHSFFVNPLVTTLIVLDSIGDNFCPSVGATGQASIKIQKPPVAVGVEVVCDYVDATYIVKFTASGGIAPYDIINGNLTGTFMDSLFQSDPLPWGTPFFGILNDALQCGTDTIEGAGNCACITDAGSMNSLKLDTICAGDSTMLAYNNDAVLDGNDVQRFVLHTLSDTVLGNVLAVNTTSRFGFDPATMTYGVVYYVSSMAGNFDGVNGVDTADVCFDVSPGTPVVWTVPPTAAMSDTFDVCPGVQLLIPVALTGQAPFMFTYTNNGSPVNVSPFSTNFGILATLTTSTTYVPVSIKDANGCTGTVSGQSKVNVHQAPDIINVKVTCSPDNLTYVLEFDVTKVDLGPGSVSITGNVTGTYNDATGHFTSNPIPRTTNYALTVTDIKYNCGIDNISGQSNCPCPTKAGSMPQTPLVLCVGAPANALPAIGSVLEPGDTLVYALITGNPSQPNNWVVLATNTTPQFAYDPLKMVPGTTYLIVAVAANASPVPPGVDLNDPCLSVTPGPTVTWRVAPTAAITGDASICAGKSATLTITFTGTGPFVYTYTDGTTPQTLISNGNTTTLNVSPTVSTTYTLTNVSGAGDCPGTVSGSATITIRTPPTAALNGNFTLCAGENVNFPITFTGSAPFQFVYAIDGVAQQPLSSPTTSFFLSVNDLQAPHVVTLLSVEDANCTGTVSGMVNIAVSQPPTAGLSGSTTICAGDSASLTLNLSGATTFDVTISGGLQPIQLTGVSTGKKVTVKPTATTTYLITAVAPSGNTCTPTITTDATVVVTNLSATANVSNYSGFGVSCPGQQDGSISLNPVGGTPPFTAVWSPAGNGLQLSNLDTGTYTVLLTDLTGCRFRDTFTLDAPTGIKLDFEVVSPACFGQTNGVLSITGITGGSGPYSLTINDTLAQLGPNLPAVYAPLDPGDYVLVLTDANGCETEEVAIIALPPALMVDLGPDISLALGDSTLLKFETNAVLLDTFFWTPTRFLRTPNLKETWALPTETQEYTLSIRDTLGCTAEDRIVVTVNDLGRIYVPNVIDPESFTFNDIVTVFAGPEVQRVLSFRIFDRWGSQVYEDKDFEPNQDRRG